MLEPRIEGEEKTPGTAQRIEGDQVLQHVDGIAKRSSRMLIPVGAHLSIAQSS